MKKTYWLKFLLLGAVLATSAVQLAAASAPRRLKPGDKAPDFTLTDLKGDSYKLSSLTQAGKIVVLEWISPECPISMGYYEKNGKQSQGLLPQTYSALKGKDLAWLALNSLSTKSEGNSVDDNRKMVKNKGVPYPVLLDSDKKVAQAFGALTTPDIFIVGPDLKVVYCGAVDEGSFGEFPKGTNYITAAAKALRNGKQPAVQETQPFGCSL